MAERLVFVFGILCTCASVSKPLISRCIESPTDMVSFHCPRRMVIYKLNIFLGVSDIRSCTTHKDDRLGLTPELEDQMNKCHWKQQCTLTWGTNRIPSSENQTHTTYVTYDRPHCVRKNKIYDICSVTDDITKTDSGVIRSHALYPEGYDSLRGEICSVRLKPRPQHHLKVQLDRADLHQDDLLRIRGYHPYRTFLSSRRSENQTFIIETGYVEITFQISPNTNNRSKGFMLRFENVKIAEIFPVPGDYYISPKRHPSKRLSKFEATVTEKLKKKSELFISCPAGHVINKLDMSAGREKGKPYDVTTCPGKYSSLLADTNKCLWKRSCQVTKTARQPLTLISSTKCIRKLGVFPNFIAIRILQCMPKENVVNICDLNNKIIKSAQGVIKSHDDYPWHYPTRRTICRKKIIVDRLNGLRLYTESVDLDPGTRGDNIKFYINNGRKTLVKKLVGNQEIDMKVRSGIVEIVFRISRRSQGGQGFLIRFEPLVSQYGKLQTKKYSSGPVTALAVSRARKPCSAKDNGNRIRAIIFQEGKKVKIPERLLCSNRGSRIRRRLKNKKMSDNKGSDILSKISQHIKKKKNEDFFGSVNLAATNDWF